MIPDLAVIREQVIEDMVTNAENYVAIYARQSNKSEKVHSTDVQLQKGQQLAVKNNLLIYKTYSEKISGREDPYYEREEFNNLLQDAEEGLFKNIIVYKRDRLSRDMQDFLEIKKVFKRLGIKVIYSCEQEFQSDGGPTSDFIENIIAAVASLEPSMIKDRAMAGRREQRKNRVYSPGGSIPYGFRMVDKNIFQKLLKNLNGEAKEFHEMRQDCKYYVARANTWDFIKKLFDKYTTDKNIKTSSDLFKALIDEEIEIPEDFDKDNVRGIILNPIYGGLQLSSLDYELKDSFRSDDKRRFTDIDKEYFQDVSNVIGLVPRDIWFEAAKKWLLNNDPFDKRTRINSYLFKGLLECSKCGKKISKSNDLYFCGTRDCTRIDKDDLYKHLLERIINDLINEKTSKEFMHKQIENLNNKINSNIKEVISTNTDMERHIRNYVYNQDDEHLCESIEKGNKKLSFLKAEGEKLQVNKVYLEKIRDIMISEYGKVNIYSLTEVMIKQEELTQKHLTKNIEQVKIYGRRQSPIRSEIVYR